MTEAPITEREAAALAARQATEAADQEHARQVEKVNSMYGTPAPDAHTWDETTHTYMAPETRQDQRAEQAAAIREQVAQAEAAGDRGEAIRLKAALILI